MLKLNAHMSNPSKTLALLPKPFIHGNGATSLGSFPTNSTFSFPKTQRKVRVRSKPGSIKALLTIRSAPQALHVKAVLTVTLPSDVFGFIKHPTSFVEDKFRDWWGKSLLLELVSADLDPKSGMEKPRIRRYAEKSGEEGSDHIFEAKFSVPTDFGEVGAIAVENELHEEMRLKDIVLEGFPTGPAHFYCHSWIQPTNDETGQSKRVMFTSKSYLPSQTPGGLKKLREEELKNLQGTGEGQRNKGERIYDYDVYNDLGQPDDDVDLARPVLGGKDQPYPRRCRTGRPRCLKDPYSETRTNVLESFYVPRDEEFSELKSEKFNFNLFKSLLHMLIPSLESILGDNKNLSFPYFEAVDSLFNEGINVPPLSNKSWKHFLPNIIKVVEDTRQEIVRFETPETMERDRFFWLRDEEFARQTLAGLHPCSLQLITEWPLKSKLDPNVYGPPESAITTELIEQEIKGFSNVEEAIKQKKLFMLDYHDLYLPFVSQIRKVSDNTTMYGSRTIFFLLPDGTLRPLAIELTRPPMDGKSQWKQVYRPSWHSTGVWLWRLAKIHVLAHDSGYHQLISHWLRTHCCVEPYVIAAHRHLSALHPIYRLLHPHFRYTMEINALARQSLINAGGIIESCFAPDKYSMFLSSVIYDKLWRFDHQGLPQDLISRGMAVEDPSAPHGLKLTIEDYPFANDGLVLWDNIKEWVSDYVNYYYPDPDLVASDDELQGWWDEVRNVGHGDKKDEPWWPQLKTEQDLIEIITTIIWTASAHHAAVNFGQYPFAGYFPNRPTTARIKMPNEDPTPQEWELFLNKPENVLLKTFPSQVQAAKVMAVLDVLSNHSPEEEYIGDAIEGAWFEDPFIKGAFEKFGGKLKELEGIIDERNADIKLKNRNGAGILGYNLLKPFSDPGVTGRGVPYSISI